MAPELRHLRYLLAVVECGSFTRAAEELHVSQPTLSQQIKQLERTLGVQLLDRTGRAVRPTDAGEAYVRHVRAALRDLDSGERAVHDVQDLSRGHLRLATTPTFTSYLVGPLAAELRTRHPGVTLTIEERAQDEIEARVLADDLDAGIGFGDSATPGIGATALFEETLSLVRGRAVTAAAVEDRELALLTRDFVTRTHIDAYFAQHGINPRITVEAHSIQALLEIVRRTPVATVLPDVLAHDHPDLTTIPLDPGFPARTVVLLRRAGAYESAAVRAFLRLLPDVVANLL
ncbi:transcriptional regulator CynR [Amycolatopsis carbonis]|uniref:Transcriptional regulator CynR n=1 Tax=Amycolatopsis carbonis TaxID=715471 RepID=A0A9Y2MVW4_9PSEU|nr:transcriptional regulator CynR [Amycolatopsis sp. 2-15]WIX77157.1 transcriptional regulator CynR [Amycolatopsis sp. 2-15]